MSLKEKIQVVLNQKGQFRCPNGAQKKLPETSKAAADRYSQVVTNLEQRGSAKPGTVSKLKSTIAALFQNKLSADEIESLVQQLRSRGAITVSGAKVTYV